MRLADYYLDHLLEPDMPVMNERRALRSVPEPRTYDVEREAEWRRQQEWQWREDCAKREDERIERARNKSK